jgi:hypothetical protein
MSGLFMGNNQPPTVNAYGVPILIGLFLGMGLIPIFQMRKVIMSTMLGLFKKPPSEVEEESPLPYNIIWIGLILSALGLVGCFMWANTSFVPSILAVSFMIVIILGAIRIIVESGGWYGILGYGNALQNNWGSLIGPSALAISFALGLMPDPTSTMSNVEAAANAFAFWWQYNGQWILVPLIMGWFGLSAFRTGGDTGVSKKGILYMLIFCGLVGPILMQIFGMIWWHVYPLGAVGFSVENWQTWFGVQLFRYTVTTSENLPFGGYWGRSIYNGYTPQIIGAIAGGFILVALLTFMRTKLSWFTVSVAGICLGMNIGPNIFLPFLIAYIAKYLTMKLRGVKFYMEVGKPVALGLIVGWCLTVLWIYFYTWIARLGAFGAQVIVP